MSVQYALMQEELSPELLLLLDLLRPGDTNRENSVQQVSLKDIDWKHFVHLAMHHRVYPYLYPIVSRMQDQGIPPAVTGHLQMEYRRNTMQMLQLTGEMGKLADELAGRGIRSIFLKGPVLAQDLYGDVSLRTSRDLDFIVPIGQLKEAEALLISRGFVKEEEFETILGDWKWRQHHNSFNHPERNIKVEIHWRMNPSPSKEPGFDELWERSRVSGSLGRHVRYLGVQDLFLFLTAHGARHGWSRLRWLLDIRKLLEQRPDSAKLVRHLRRYGYSDMGGQALILAAGLLGTPLDPGLSGLAARPKAQKLARLAMFYVGRMVNLHNPPLPPEVERHFKYYQPAILPVRRQILYALGFLHPYAADAKTLPLPQALHFLYFPLRPFLWAWRKASLREKGTPSV